MQDFIVWFTKVFKKWFWLLGLIPTIRDIVDTYLPSSNIPMPIVDFLTKEIDWRLSLVYITLGFLISSYLVYYEKNYEFEKILKELDQIKSIKPRLDIGYLIKNKKVIDDISIKFNPIKEHINIKNEIEKKKQFFIDERKLQSRNSSNGIYFALLGEVNKNYENDIDVYLEKYEEALKKINEAYYGRAFTIKPLITNIGDTSATNVILDFRMPMTYNKPLNHQMSNSDETIEMVINEIFRDLPPIPKYRRDFGFNLALDYSLPIDIRPVQIKIDRNDPVYEERDNLWHIIYHLEKINPKQDYQQFNPFNIWAGDVQSNLCWEIIVNIFASELSIPCEKELRLNFEITK